MLFELDDFLSFLIGWAGANRKHHQDVIDRLNRIERKIDKMAGTIADELNTLQAAVTQETSVEQSAVTLISGFAAQLAAAIAAATANGATPEQLAELDTLSSQISASSTTLAAAVAANTPAAA